MNLMERVLDTDIGRGILSPVLVPIGIAVVRFDTIARERYIEGFVERAATAGQDSPWLRRLAFLPLDRSSRRVAYERMDRASLEYAQTVSGGKKMLF